MAVRQLKSALESGNGHTISDWVPDSRGALDINEWERMEGGLNISSSEARAILATLWSRASAPPVVEGYACYSAYPECSHILVVITGLGDIYHVPPPTATPTPLATPEDLLYRGPARPNRLNVRVAAWQIQVDPSGSDHWWKVWWTPRDTQAGQSVDEDYIKMVTEIVGSGTFYVLR